MAIAYDTSADGGEVNPGTSLSWSHTCTGSQRLLVVACRGGLGEGDRITGVTYNSVSMTQVGTAIRPGDENVVSLYYLLNPNTGTNTVEITLTSGYMEGESASYTGVKQLDQPDSSNTGIQENNASITVSTTTVADNSWVIGSFFGGIGEPTAGSGTTEREDLTYDNNAAKTPAGSVSLTVQGGDGGSDWATVMASFAPYIPSAGDDTQGYFLL